MTYALYNTEKKAFLTHPKIGLWLSPSLKNAQEMRDATHAYLKICDLDDFIPRIVIVDYVTKEIIHDSDHPRIVSESR